VNILPEKKPGELPQGVVLEKPPFVPRMVMTNELQTVARDVMTQWRNRKAFAPLLKYGIRPLHRLLFYGPPGNGKTMACYWIARELGIPVYRVLCNQIHNCYVGETEKAVAGVMDYFSARKEPALCLWDEIEAIFPDRAKQDHHGSGRGIASALTIFMQALDRWQSPTLLVMATNLPDRLDAALLSRVELRIEFAGPNEDQCEQCIQYWREILCDHGADEWGPLIVERVKEKLPISFRELQQTIAFAAREWTARFRAGPRSEKS
jgi:AAA+ superfamily predicted ATPase